MFENIPAHQEEIVLLWLFREMELERMRLLAQDKKNKAKKSAAAPPAGSPAAAPAGSKQLAPSQLKSPRQPHTCQSLWPHFQQDFKIKLVYIYHKSFHHQPVD